MLIKTVEIVRKKREVAYFYYENEASILVLKSRTWLFEKWIALSTE